MSEKTKHRGYTVPDAGAENWHTIVNENWNAIDEDIQAILETAQAAMEALSDGETTDGAE